MIIVLSTVSAISRDLMRNWQDSCLLATAVVQGLIHPLCSKYPRVFKKKKHATYGGYSFRARLDWCVPFD